jgi:hypothetical protein
VWGGITAHGRTPLVAVAGNLTGIRYRDEIVQPYVIPFIQAQTNNVTFQQVYSILSNNAFFTKPSHQ